MSTEQVRIPDIGDAEEVEVIEVYVAEGDRVEVDDSLIVIESDKASLDVPSTVAGRVEAVKVSVGDTCGEGDVIAEIELEDEDAGGERSGGGEDSEASAEEESEGKASGAEAEPEERDEDDERHEGDEGDEGEESEQETASDTDTESRGDGGERSAASDEKASAAEGGTTEEVRVPDIGDAGEVEVIEIMVAVGDEVEAEDGLVVLESDKATMDVPAPKAGRVASVEVKEGDRVGEGSLIATLEVAGGGRGGGEGEESEGRPERSGRERDGEQKRAAPGADEREKPAREAGSAEEDGDEARDATPAERTEGRAESGQRAARGGGMPRQVRAPVPPAPEERSEEGKKVYAGPAVRRLARELGVDLTRVEGSGDRGRVLKEDVHAFVKSRMTGDAEAPAAGGGAIPEIPRVDFSRFGETEQEPLSRIMRSGAANLHRAWLNIPHVTQHDEADVTELEAFRRSLRQEAEQRGVKLTPLAFLMKAVIGSLQAFPRLNGSFAGDGENYVLKRYYHIGFAVDTPEGLLVPVIRDVDRKGVWDLAEEIGELSARARELKLKPDEMRGGSFSISSLGPIGGTGFTPVINAPEVAILGVSKLVTKPVWDGEQFVPREMLPLSLSYDHRAINGAEAGRFVVHFCGVLNDLRRLLM